MSPECCASLRFPSGGEERENEPRERPGGCCAPGLGRWVGVPVLRAERGPQARTARSRSFRFGPSKCPGSLEASGFYWVPLRLGIKLTLLLTPWQNAPKQHSFCPCLFFPPPSLHVSQDARMVDTPGVLTTAESALPSRYPCSLTKVMQIQALGQHYWRYPKVGAI